MMKICIAQWFIADAIVLTSPQKLSLKIAKDLGMYKKAKKQVVSNQYLDPSQIVGDQHS